MVFGHPEIRHGTGRRILFQADWGSIWVQPGRGKVSKRFFWPAAVRTGLKWCKLHTFPSLPGLVGGETEPGARGPPAGSPVSGCAGCADRIEDGAGAAPWRAPAQGVRVLPAGGVRGRNSHRLDPFPSAPNEAGAGRVPDAVILMVVVRSTAVTGAA